jgi:hypothetical protein
MPILAIHDVKSWRRVFDETKISIGVETALPWIGLPSTVAHHIKSLVKSILFGLARLGARTTPRNSVIGQEFAERHLGDDAFLFSHHSIGAGEGICRFKHTYRSGYFTFDALGYAGFSQLARSPEMLEAAWALPPDAALAFAASLRRDQIEHNTSKFVQPPISKAGPEPGYVFLALQAVGDTVVRLAPSDPQDFYRRVVTEAGNAGLRCVVKRHPRCKRPDVTKFIASIADLPHVTMTDLSINQLLPKAERVVVINSTVGFEALIHGRPTLTFGASEYAPLTTLIRHVDDIAHALTSPPWFDELKTAQFLQYFFEKYSVHADDEDRIFRKLQETLAVLPPRFGWTVEP